MDVKNNYIKSIVYHGHEIKFFYRPGLYNPQLVQQIKQDLNIVNNNTLKLNYGFFDEEKDFRETSKNALISIIYLNNSPIGFFYDFIIDERYVHFGLVVIEKNIGVDLVAQPRLFSIMWLRDIFGHNFYGTFLTSIPKIIESVGDIFYNAWPTSSNYSRLINKQYRDVLDKIYNEYVQKFFPFPESLSLDKKRFVLISQAKEMGFERNIKKMPLAQNLMVNLFCQFWLDYAQNEDLFQVIEVDEQTIENFSKNFPEISELYEKSK